MAFCQFCRCPTQLDVCEMGLAAGAGGHCSKLPVAFSPFALPVMLACSVGMAVSTRLFFLFEGRLKRVEEICIMCQDTNDASADAHRECRFRVCFVVLLCGGLSLSRSLCCSGKLGPKHPVGLARSPKSRHHRCRRGIQAGEAVAVSFRVREHTVAHVTSRVTPSRFFFDLLSTLLAMQNLPACAARPQNKC